ncbi:hypothetical protein ACFX2I_006033 [Malus domestica]
MAEVGESSGTKPSEEFWAKLVPSDSRYLDVQISSDEIVLCSEILFSSIRKCKCGEIFKPISEQAISGIPSSAHENNRHEQVITEKCIAQLGRTLQDVVAEWLAKLNNREIDEDAPESC